MTENMQITRTQSLKSIEEQLHSLNQSAAANVVFKIPKNLGPTFFKLTWAVAAMATAYRHVSVRRGSVAVSSWTKSEDTGEHSKAQFKVLERHNSPLDLAQSTYATTPHDALSPSHPRTEDTTLAEHTGLVVFEGENQVLAIYAIDPDAPIPIALGTSRARDQFLNEFRRVKRKYLDVGNAAHFSKRHPHYDRLISELILELFHNTLEHGRLSADDNTVLRGLRYVHLSRHIGHTRESFVGRAAEFPELQTYLNSVVPERGTFSLLEIAISDAGIGIVDRFLSTRRDLNILANTPENRLDVINRIIRERLSSKMDNSGAGAGILNALTAIADLQGFISLRSGNEWAFRDYSAINANRTPEYIFRFVSLSRDLARISGTHYNILVPLS